MAYTTFILPFRPVFDSNGLPVPGAKLNFYLTGTLIRSPVYADSALTTQLPNPVVANSAGRFVDIFLDAAVIYRVTITDENDVLLDDSDPYAFGNAGVSVDLISTQTISGAKTFSSGLTTADEAYGVAWDANLTVPTKNAVYDKMQTALGTVTAVSVTTAAGVSGTVANATTTPAITLTLGAITPSSVTVTDAAYSAAWNGSLQVPTKNAVYDKIETLGGGATYKAVGSTIFGPPHMGPNGTGMALTLSTLYAIPFASSGTFDSIWLNVSTAASAGGVARVGIYSNNNGQPGTLLQAAAEFATTTTGLKTGVITATAVSDLIWIVINTGVAICSVTGGVTSNDTGPAGALMGVVNPASGTYLGITATSVYGALPSTFPVSTSLNSTAMPYLAMGT